MKRYAFPLTIILLLFAVIALAAPGDKRPAVTSAAIGLGTSSSPTLASITATTSVTAPTFASSAADGYHYIRPYNSIAFAGTPLAGMFVTTPTGPQWYTGSAWEAIGGGGASAIADLTDWPSGLTAMELGYLDGATSNIQAQINAISVGSPVTTAPTYSDQSCTAGQYAFDASYAYFCRAANTWDRIALGGWSNPSPVAPTFSSFTINSAGTGLTASLSASTTVGAGGSGGLALTCSTAGTVAATYGSGSPGTSYTYALGSTIYSGDTCTAAYTQPGNGLEGTTGGADVATVAGVSVTNGSTATQSASYSDSFTYSSGLLSSVASSWPAVTGWTTLTVTSGGQLQGVTNANYANYYNGVEFSSNQCSKVAIPTVSGYGVGPMVRVQTGAATAYEVQTVSSTTLRVRKFVAGAGSTLGTDITGVTVADGDTVEICANGTSPVDLTVYQNNNLVGTRTDSSSTITGGYPGIYMYGTGSRVDNAVLRDL